MSILDVLIAAAVGLVRGLFALIPSVEVPGMGGFGAHLGSAVGAVNGVAPVVTLGVALGLIVASRIIVFGVELAIRVYELLPFKAT